MNKNDNTGLKLIGRISERATGKNGELFTKALKKLAFSTEKQLKNFLNEVQTSAIKTAKVVLQIIHADYKPIRQGIVINAKNRDRKTILENNEKYVLGDNFTNKILPLLTTEATLAETLREDELLKYKTDADICKEMGIIEIPANQIAERIIQRTKNIKVWTIIGYCNGFVVSALPYGVGRLEVNAYGLADWDDGCRRLLSRDMHSGTSKL